MILALEDGLSMPAAVSRIVAQSKTFLTQACGASVLAFGHAGVPRREAAELHIEDSVGLVFAQVETIYQARAGDINIGRRTNRFYHRIQVIESDEQSFEDVLSF